mgnify:CR=1 FL=1
MDVVASGVSYGVHPALFAPFKSFLRQNGFTGYERTGEIHAGHVPVVIEIVYSNGKDTVEVDVRKKDSKVVSIEQEVAFSSIPANVRKAAASSGVDLKTCGIYQKAIYKNQYFLKFNFIYYFNISNNFIDLLY